MWKTLRLETGILSIALVLCEISYGFASEYRFPDDFQFGSASSAYQTEGALYIDGRSESIWDRLINTNPDLIVDKSTANDASKSYFLYKEDVKALKELGAQFYRFSVSWPRILPNGDLSVINEVALQHYDNMIDELIENGIEPMITMFHWDLPQVLEDFGGWTSPLISTYFFDYATVLFNRFGEKVKSWITLNEPTVYCELTYWDLFSPMEIRVYAPGVGTYLCIHHMLIAHAKVYHAYKDYYNYLNGTIALADKCEYHWPKDYSNEEDIETAKRLMQLKCGWIFHPIYSETGGYPKEMIEVIDRRSKIEGRKISRLPEMDDKIREYIKGTGDYLALNYYTSRIATNSKVESEYPSYNNDLECELSVNGSWRQAKSDWLYEVPEGLRLILKWMKKEYKNPKIMIVENGYSDSGELEDNGRVKFYKEHLNAVLNAIHIDKCQVIGYTAWSLTDNFEWMAGYTERFGLYHVDFDSPNRERTPKKSAKFIKEVISTRTVPNFK